MATQQTLAERAGLRCSRDGCEQPTSGPRADPERSINLGVAAHISAASPGGPRHDAGLSPEQRRSVENGIWLCQSCAKLIDNDPTRYTVERLLDWKHLAERRSLARLEAGQSDLRTGSPFDRLESLMPDFLAEMAVDLNSHPLAREFACLKKAWSYSGKPDDLAYYYEDHPQLDSIVRILQNHAMIYDITTRNVARYCITEELADYLSARQA